MRFTIYMRRRTLYYLFNIIFPCLWLTVLSLISFWLPPDSGEKITLGITVLLAFSVFMLLIAENMPATSEFVPLIGKSIAGCSGETFLSAGVARKSTRNNVQIKLSNFVWYKVGVSSHVGCGTSPFRVTDAGTLSSAWVLLKNGS